MDRTIKEAKCLHEEKDTTMFVHVVEKKFILC